MGSQSSLIEEPHSPSVVTVQNLARHSSRVIPSKLPHQDTCESDGGILEDIGKEINCVSYTKVTVHTL